jgi:hypothetical protein
MEKEVTLDEFCQENGVEGIERSDFESQLENEGYDVNENFSEDDLKVELEIARGKSYIDDFEGVED